MDTRFRFEFPNMIKPVALDVPIFQDNSTLERHYFRYEILFKKSLAPSALAFQ